MKTRPGGPSRFLQGIGHRGTDRFAETNVGHNAVIEKGGYAPFGKIDELIRQHDIARPNGLFHAPRPR